MAEREGFCPGTIVPIASPNKSARCRVGKNSPPDCFLPQTEVCSLLVRIPFKFNKEIKK